MGKLSHDPYIQHFSHEHPLELSNFQSPSLNFTTCSGCRLKPSALIYICKPCNYILHISCSQMPKLINHPADPNHPLTLLPYPAYPEGLFNCDACGHQGNGFSYHCGLCNLDIHTYCASMPLRLNHTAHPHVLNLNFCPPYQTKGFSCDICQKLGSNHWLYRCNLCEFDAHLGCATAKPVVPVQQLQMQPPLLQHNQSFPGANLPHLQTPGSAYLGNVSRQQNYYVHNPSMGVTQTVQPARNNSAGNTLMNGLVDGLTQQIGQSILQSIMGGSNGGGSGDIAGGDSSGDSSSILDLGSSVLGNVLGDSGF